MERSLSRLTRREFLWTFGSSVAAAGLTAGGLAGCSSAERMLVQSAPTGTVRGTVTDLQGTPQPIGRIYLLLVSGLNQNLYADVTSTATFDLGQIPVGDYQLRFWGGQEAEVPEPLPNPVRITVTENQTTVVQFQIALGTPNANEKDIFAGDYFFQEQPFGQPNAKVVVKQGVTVCWYNVGSTAHTVTGGPWGDSGPIGIADEFNWVANQIGTFGYRCNYHNPQMQSILQVTA